MKVALIGIAIVVIGALFVLQDFGSQIISDTPEPEQPVIKRAVDKEPEPPVIRQAAEPEPIQTQNNCDPSYPSICIPSYPPDLDCGEIGYSNFRVVPPDPHGFDRDRDGTGCEVGSPSNTVQPTQENNCDSSYPDVCIPSYPPDLDCGEIGYSNFRVTGSDQHGFDGDKDGIGCEKSSSSTSQSTSKTDCDPSYPDFCIPSSPPDLDCKDIPQKRFTVLQPDPHRFDGDKDGIGCES